MPFVMSGNRSIGGCTGPIRSLSWASYASLLGIGPTGASDGSGKVCLSDVKARPGASGHSAEREVVCLEIESRHGDHCAGPRSSIIR